MFLWVETPGICQLSLLLRVSQICSEGVAQDAFSSGGSTGEEPSCKLIHDVGRIHFLALI